MIPVESFPSFDQVSVISDLHMGGPADHQIFREGSLLARFIDHLCHNSPNDCALVINGDMVDFLAEDDPKPFDPDGAIAKLDSMYARPEFAPVWNALVHFTNTPGRHLAITLGNHDVELALPWVREHFLELLTGGDAASRKRITLSFDGSGFACAVGNKRVLCVHGNEVDSWNVTNYEALRQIAVDRVQKGNVSEWTPNAGTKLVIEVMNAIKRKHAFVDILKPETEAVTKIVYALKPSLRSKLRSLSAQVTRIWDATKRKFRIMGEEDDGEEAADGEARVRSARLGDADALMDRIEEKFQANTDPLEWIEESESDRLGWGGEVGSQILLGEPHEVAWHGVKELMSDSTFLVHYADPDYHKVNALVSGRFDYVIAGHTHLARSLGNARRTYFNTGTWASLMKLKPEHLESAEKFKPFFDRLKAAETIPELGEDLVFTRPTVATITRSHGEVNGTLKKVTCPNGEIKLEDVKDNE